jgi:hypothetical protein
VSIGKDAHFKGIQQQRQDWLISCGKKRYYKVSRSKIAQPRIYTPARRSCRRSLALKALFKAAPAHRHGFVLDQVSKYYFDGIQL